MKGTLVKMFSKLLTAFFRPFWRVTRGTTMGAQAVVIDHKSRVLLVRHGYRPGWHFPGGGVEHYEALAEAMERELFEETRVELTGKPKLHGIFTNFEKFKGDHIGVFIVQDWKQDEMPKPNAEIKEIGFFYRDELPEHTVTGVINRLDEIFEGKAISNEWK
ncbi:MAG: NUDIX hydrolase [Methyloligella sp.]|nr:MAG: NUDIX hydrolase [Methyloligella sp.]